MDKLVCNYSVAIRTLGKSGIAYETLIRCLKSQTVAPQNIIVYIAEGYDPPRRVADEVFVHCKKGMASQRALAYNEISSEYILLCDDDLYLAENAVEQLFEALIEMRGDCISPNVFPNHEMRCRTKYLKAIYYGELPSFRTNFAFRVRGSSNYSYCNNPLDVMESQSCAGPCMLIKKSVNNSLHYEDEVWMDYFPYTSGQDQIFAFKLYRYGYKLLIHYKVSVIHLDAKTGHVKDLKQADFNKRMIRYIEWYRSVYEPASSFQRIFALLSYYSFWLWLLLVAALGYCVHLKGGYKLLNSFLALKSARKYVNSNDYKSIPSWQVVR